MALQDPIVIVGAARTPIGSFQGELKDAAAPKLGATAIRAALQRSGVGANGAPKRSGRNVYKSSSRFLHWSSWAWRRGHIRWSTAPVHRHRADWPEPADSEHSIKCSDHWAFAIPVRYGHGDVR